MPGCPYTWIFFLSSSFILLTVGIHIKSEYRFLPRSQLQQQTEPPKILFRRFNSTGDAFLFIAYLNKISHISPDSLSVINERIIGPKNCSIFCFIHGGSGMPCSQYADRPLPPGYTPNDCGPRLTNAFVKSWSTSNFEYVEPPISHLALEIVGRWRKPISINNDFIPVEDALYVCYNVFHGFCERLQLTNISVTRSWVRRSSMNFYPKRSSEIPIPVVNWDASLSSTLTVDSNFIYVGLEQDRFQDATLVDLDPLSVRLRDFDYASKEPSLKSSLSFRENDVRIKYKFSFQYTLRQDRHESASNIAATLHIYFVAQQPNILEPGMQETRIARICSGDKFFHSYADLALSCDGCLFRGRDRNKMVFYRIWCLLIIVIFCHL